MYETLVLHKAFKGKTTQQDSFKVELSNLNSSNNSKKFFLLIIYF